MMVGNLNRIVLDDGVESMRQRPYSDNSDYEVEPVRGFGRYDSVPDENVQYDDPVETDYTSYADDSSYSEYHEHEYWGEDYDEPEQKSSSGSFWLRSVSSRSVIYGLLAIGLLLGFTLGLVSGGAIGTNGNSSPPLYDENLVTSIFDAASPAVVEINVIRYVGRSRVPINSTGSGFFVDSDGHIITNNHVIDGAEEISVNLSDGRKLAARTLGTSPADDLALLQVDANEVDGIQPLVLADSEQITPGQMAIAVGSPFRNFNSVTVGVVSGTGRGPTSALDRPIPDMIQTDAALNPGNSGGPLLNADGEVIGVNSSVRTSSVRGLTDFRIGFAVPSNTIRDLMPDLLTSGQVRRPWLGIGGARVSTDVSRLLGISEGIVVSQVFQGSPAQKAGLVPLNQFRSTGDVITGVDGHSVASVDELVSYFNTRKPGDAVTLSIFRNNKTIEVNVTLGELPIPNQR